MQLMPDSKALRLALVVEDNRLHVYSKHKLDGVSTRRKTLSALGGKL